MRHLITTLLVLLLGLGMAEAAVTTFDGPYPGPDRPPQAPATERPPQAPRTEQPPQAP